MILRLLRARVIAGEEARLARFVRDEAVAHALKVPGLVSLQPAVRQSQAGTELAIVTTWEGFDDLLATGRTLDAPLAMPGAASMLTDSHADHYELVLGEARALPLREGKLRLPRIPIKSNTESRYYDSVRHWADQLLDQSGLVAFTLGRRVVGRQDEIVAVQVWQDEAALRDVAGADVDQPMGRDELSQYWAAEPSIEHFDALTAVEPRPNAPAILVADSDRRYVHATPAAARLTGHPLARLLTMRIEDIGRRSERADAVAAWDRFVSAGTMSGPTVLVRPDGSEVEVQYAARTDAPWPGTHTSLLVPLAGERRGSEELGQPGPLDVDRALAEAGFVARYAPA